MHKENTGFEIHKTDLDCIINRFSDNLNQLTSTPQKSTDYEYELILNIHWMVQMLIPISSLGNYNKDLQKYIWPSLLLKLGDLLEYINENFYKKKI